MQSKKCDDFFRGPIFTQPRADFPNTPPARAGIRRASHLGLTIGQERHRGSASEPPIEIKKRGAVTRPHYWTEDAPRPDQANLLGDRKDT